MRCQRTAFTLVELLVVVAIIAVLLALLTPALDQGIYQAELATCGTKLKGISTGVQTYAVDFKRWYPDRPAVRGNISVKTINWGGYDSRPVFRPYMSINGNLLCPLTPAKVDYDGSRSTTSVEAAYNLFFGSQFKDEAGNLRKGMFRLGDRFEWEGQNFHVMAGDYDEIAPTYSVAYNSHPDFDGVAAADVYQDKQLLVFGDFTLSRWAYFTGTHKRPPVDMQHVFDDGAVGRYEKVTWDEAEPTGPGPMAKAHGYTSTQAYSGGAGQWIHVPRR